MKWSVYLSGSAERDFKHLDQQSAERVTRALRRLAEGAVANIKRIKGSAGEQRLRVGDLRVLFRVQEAECEIEVIRILPRDKAYRVREPAGDYAASRA